MKDEPGEKVAVIAVHGVAHHAPGQSVRDVAGILTPLRDSAYFLKYAPFTEDTIRIAIDHNFRHSLSGRTESLGLHVQLV